MSDEKSVPLQPLIEEQPPPPCPLPAPPTSAIPPPHNSYIIQPSCPLKNIERLIKKIKFKDIFHRIFPPQNKKAKNSFLS